jgi:hypothetical protein
MNERVLAIVLVLVVIAGSQPALIVHRVIQAILACIK